MTTWDERGIDCAVHANTADIITGLSRTFPLHLHVPLKLEHELARILQRRRPICIIWVIAENLVEESEAVLPDLQHSAMLLEKEFGERFQIA